MIYRRVHKQASLCVAIEGIFANVRYQIGMPTDAISGHNGFRSRALGSA